MSNASKVKKSEATSQYLFLSSSYNYPGELVLQFTGFTIILEGEIIPIEYLEITDIQFSHQTERLQFLYEKNEVWLEFAKTAKVKSLFVHLNELYKRQRQEEKAYDFSPVKEQNSTVIDLLQEPKIEKSLLQGFEEHYTSQFEAIKLQFKLLIHEFKQVGLAQTDEELLPQINDFNKHYESIISSLRVFEP